MKIESFDTLFSAPADQLTRDQIIDILIDDDLQDYDNNFKTEWMAEILANGFVGYENQTDNELFSEYTERREMALFTFGTDAENGVTA